jgi:hypothetical protein
MKQVPIKKKTPARNLKRFKENEQNYQGTQILKMHTKFIRKYRGMDKLLERPRRSREDNIKIGLA